MLWGGEVGGEKREERGYEKGRRDREKSDEREGG